MEILGDQMVGVLSSNLGALVMAPESTPEALVPRWYITLRAIR